MNSLFSPEDSQLVQSIRLSEYAVQDCLIWPYTKNMKYSVKSGYWVMTHELAGDEVINPPPGSLVLKSQVWKLDILPKIKQFLWRLLSGALSTFSQLCTRGVHIDPTCQRCCLEDETINHIFFGCPYAIATWKCSNIPIYNRFTQDLEENMTLIFQFQRDSGEEREISLLPFWILWFVWKSRNEYLFNKRNVQPIVDANRATQAIAEWVMEVRVNQRSIARCINRPSEWEPPPSQWLKCNFDCSFSMANEFTTVGWILRDDRGGFFGAASMKMRSNQVGSALIGEAYAFLFALQSMWMKGWRKVWFEGDNLELTRIVNTKAWHLELGNLMYDIRYWISRLPQCSLEQVNRERNQAADIISRKALEYDSMFIYYNSVPVWLVKFLYHPFTI